MSNEPKESNAQLSWEQLLKSAVPGDGDVVAQNPQPALETKPLKKAKRKSRAKAAADSVPASAAVAEVKQEYAKKDWGKLEFPPSKTALEEKALAVKSTRIELESEIVVTVEKSAGAPTAKIAKPERHRTAPPVDAPTDAEPAAAAEPKVITVSQLNRHIRELLEGEFPLLWLKGEISNFKAHTSGHFYFSLKDSKAQISAVMFRGFNSQLRFRPEDGMEVLVRGKVTVYEPRGNYQIFCEMMEPVGAGALQKAFEQLKAKLQKEGLFDEARKRRLPTLPKHIAIVTSPTGAAIRDMLNVLGRRFKGARITVIPCKVQGDQAPREIVEALRLGGLLKDVDVMIVGRGGGSIEDLWAFNDEAVARAIAAARVPVISAVGHEVDFTIADFVADLRAPTPSAAAELVVRSAAELSERVAALSRALRLAMLRSLNAIKQSTVALAKRLVDPQRRIQDASLRCDELLQRLQYATLRALQERRMNVELLERKLGTPLSRINHEREVITGLGVRLKNGTRNLYAAKRAELDRQMAVLDSLSPLKVLDRGYSMVVQGEKIVTNVDQLKPGDLVTVRMCKGSFDAEVKQTGQKR